MKYLSAIWKSFSLPFRPSFRAEDDVEVEKNRKWYCDEFVPKIGKDYSVALTYAHQKFDGVKGAYEALDKKAEWIFGVGIVAASAAFLALKDRQVSLWLECPFLVFAAWGILAALRARIPTSMETATSIRGVMERIENTDDATPWICASFQYAFVSMKKSTEWKALLLENACHSIFIAMIFIGLGVMLSSPVPTSRDQNKSSHQAVRLDAPHSATVGHFVVPLHLGFQPGVDQVVQQAAGEWVLGLDEHHHSVQQVPSLHISSCYESGRAYNGSITSATAALTAWKLNKRPDSTRPLSF